MIFRAVYVFGSPSSSDEVGEGARAAFERLQLKKNFTNTHS